ncbi:unnamed protein product [Phytophthora fragariaefolia]|uniref:Unnamed protein product n=1 Tax=Phytophthora fragariaefolia TaxID=1490495 RepID=A0A9W6XV78_9STRA|nr:unnamed protein product [Phytophthora fragariaefolia]
MNSSRSTHALVGPSPAAIPRPMLPLISSRSVISSILGDLTPGLVLTLSPMVFRIAWITIISTHALCATFLVAASIVYWYLTSSAMGYYVQTWAPATRNNHYEIYALGFALVCALHLIRILQLVYRSFRAKQLVFQPKSRPRPRTSNLVLPPQHFIPRNIDKPQHQSCGISKIWRALFSKQGLFGVESYYFLEIFVVREMAEVISQTYEAYWSSHLLPRVWFNSVLIVLLVTNCWSTPAVHQFLAFKPALERVVVLCVDATISITMSVVIPSLIVAPYMAGFDVAHHLFDTPELVYDPVFSTVFSLENQFVFASGLMDFGAKLVPHLATLLTLSTVAELLGRRPDPKAVGDLPSPDTIPITYRSEQEVIVRESISWVQVAVKLTFLAWVGHWGSRFVPSQCFPYSFACFGWLSRVHSTMVFAPDSVFNSCN